jgi:hypothetical protein
MHARTHVCLRTLSLSHTHPPTLSPCLPQIPREDKNGAGRVFLQYAEAADAARAHSELCKRKFGENFITARFYPDVPFQSGVYNLP